jgi:putative nucleotidyltransferase with HDIG domain
MMAKAVDERATYLRGHSERVARYSAAIARKLGLDEEKVEDIRLSALLHDIGTLGIEDYLVMKDAPLAPEEFEIVKAHTVKGAAILRPIETLHDLIPGIELHHESLDGLGYPYGLKGDQIPLMARIIAVADSFDAMTTPRPYQAAMNADYVLEVMQRLSGTRFDGAVVEALGSLVRSGALEVKKLRVPVSFRMRRPTAEVV